MIQAKLRDPENSTKPMDLAAFLAEYKTVPTLLHFRAYTTVNKSDDASNVLPDVPSCVPSEGVANGVDRKGTVEHVVSGLDHIDAMCTTCTNGSESVSKESSRRRPMTVVEVVRAVSIVGTEEWNDVLFYCLQVQAAGRRSQQIVMRTYQDFVELDKALANNNFSLAKLPRAELFGARRKLNEERFLEKRQNMLQHYLDTAEAQGAWHTADKRVEEFLRRRYFRHV